MNGVADRFLKLVAVDRVLFEVHKGLLAVEATASLRSVEQDRARIARQLAMLQSGAYAQFDRYLRSLGATSNWRKKVS
jgi:hypothetical protein